MEIENKKTTYGNRIHLLFMDYINGLNGTADNTRVYKTYKSLHSLGAAKIGGRAALDLAHNLWLLRQVATSRTFLISSVCNKFFSAILYIYPFIFFMPFIFIHAIKNSITHYAKFRMLFIR